jgi:hypothetical protein
VALHELLRSGDPGHRTALRYVLRRSQWPALIASLQETGRSRQEVGTL